jgi:hypothetical protein
MSAGLPGAGVVLLAGGEDLLRVPQRPLPERLQWLPAMPALTGAKRSSLVMPHSGLPGTSVTDVPTVFSTLQFLPDRHIFLGAAETLHSSIIMN